MFGFSIRAAASVLTMIYTLTAIAACSVHPEQEVVLPAPDIALGQSGEGVTTVHILQSRPEISLPLQQATELYALSLEEEPQFVVQTIPDAADYRAALRSRLLAAETVDLFHLQTARDTADLLPYLDDLSALPWVAETEGDALDGVALDNRIYGVPYSLSAVGLLANRNIFEAAGIPLGGIGDYAGLADAFEELQGQIDAGKLSESFPNLTAVTMLAGQDTEYLAGPVAEVMLSGTFTSRTQALYAQSAALPSAEGAESLVKLMAKYSTERGNWPGIASVAQNQQIESGIAAGRVAVILQSTDILRRILDVNPDLQGRLALLPVYFEDTEGGAVYVSSPAWWAVNAASQDTAKSQAKGFLTWLYQSDVGAAFYAEHFDALSAYGGEATGVHKQLQSMIGQGLALPGVSAEVPAGWGEQVFAPALQQYFTVYDASWDAVAEDCKNQWITLRQAD